MKMKKIFLDICIVVFIAVFLFSGYQIFSFQKEQRKISKEQNEINEIIEETQNTDTTDPNAARFTAESYDALKAINHDYVCYLEFESNLISLPIVQTDDNSYYLNHTFKKKVHSQGAPFLDYRNLLTDDNLVMYGHYVYADATKMFTPLTKLKKQANYEENKFLRLYFRDEVRTYEVVYVYEHDYTQTDYDYTKRNFGSEEDLNQFLKYPKKHNLIQSNSDVQYGDNILTLQTCVRNNHNKRLIIVAKQIPN